MNNVIVLGSGNVASHVIQFINENNELNLVQIYARNSNKIDNSINKNLVTDDYLKIKEADIYIIAVSDNSIAEVSKNLPFKNRFVVHTSGSADLDQIDSKNRRGVFYPLQTFSKNKTVDFSQIPFCLETEFENDFPILEYFTQKFSSKVYRISSEQRKYIHVTAVFVSNFTNHMFTIGNEICKENDIPFEIFKPLIQETFNKINELEPVLAQTGPAVRNDSNTLKKHLELITNEKIKSLYLNISESIQNYNVKKL
ncbi:Rossmann-like and DUF2520 domain-containing protein [Flavobacterium sp. I3-2]|uniref:Rossmann-like and DUF2520 domain-containing protein n=1 Tax=Flavobacterium sp. I3-2 TaxID=2748319 RepID=UPI0015AAA707|nr:DUF2520 domain-containing protein [Flavobacterium sp. I3-2]